MKQAVRGNDWQRIAHPRLSDDFVAAAGVLSKISKPITLGDAEPCWSMLPTASGAAGSIRLSLDIDFGGSLLRAHLDAGSLELAIDGLVSTEAFATLDRQLQQAVLEATLMRPLEVLGNRFGAAVRLLALPDAPPPSGDARTPTPEDCWAFEVYDPSGRAQCKVVVELSGPLPTSAHAALTAVERRHRNLDQVPFPVSFEVGRTSLSLAECRCLEAGDVVLLDECYLTDNRPRINVCDTLTWHGRLEHPKLVIGERITSGQAATEAMT